MSQSELLPSTVRLKRAYDAPEEADGMRVLVDRLWVRGLSKDQARLGAWMKDLGPSSELRQWFGHRPERWGGFQERYRHELSSPLRQLFLVLLQTAARRSTVTLLYGARDTRQNEAVVLCEYLLGHGGMGTQAQDDRLVLLAAVVAVAAAEPGGEAPASRLGPFLDPLASGSQLEAALQALRDHGEVKEGEEGWQLTSQGGRLLRAVSNAPAE